MPLPSMLATVLGAFLSFGIVEGASGLQAHMRQPASVSYHGRNPCPALCNVSGPDPGNWTAYHSLDQVANCKETIFYHFSIHNSIDDRSTSHRIFACTSLGMMEKKLDIGVVADKPAVQTLNNASFTLGRWNENAPRHVDVRALSEQMRRFLDGGFAALDNVPVVLFARTVSSTAGLYIGRSVKVQPTTSQSLIAMEKALHTSNKTGSSVAMQLCEDGYDGDHVFGFIATSNTAFTPVQQAVQSWANATCLKFDTTQKITSTASFTTSLVVVSNITTSMVSNNTYSARGALARQAIRGISLERRGDCTTVQVAPGDGCAKLATKCGISGSDFTKFNPSPTLCSTLAPMQRVCCSAGTLPDLSPKSHSDGSCATYKIVANDACSSIAAANSLTVDAIESYNKNTWAWNGCSLLYIGNIICLSSGTPPMPAPLANAVCGPQKPGTTAPAGGMTNITDLNPCPLNACCNIWGQCGITADFCTATKSATNAPGTAKPGTNGCISNCGTNVVQSSTPAEFISLAYYEGFGLGRPCLYQDVRQVDTSKVSHLHFAFGVLSADYQVTTGDVLSTYEFNAFKGLTNVKRVLSFGGWAFSTDPSTYNIFRNGVTSANRLKMATQIANFIKDNDLDGVDIDWEYPGAPDIPGIPAGSEDDGPNYVAFLILLKQLLPGKTVSIAAPASYWYLKAFPIASISKVVDYIVFMTYDLHGQWDAGSQYAQEGCSTGMCLRSHVNLTETQTALAMITKAGVPSNKVVVGVSSYGRSFAMAEAGCYTSDCLFTGTAGQSNAAEGPCTGTAGYISDAEIYDIINNNSSRVNQNFLDTSSNSRIVVYDNTQWVAFMDDSVRSQRSATYKALSMGGTTNWASDLEVYNKAPGNGGSWDSFKSSIKLGLDPYIVGNRTGNWTNIGCDDPAVQNVRGLTPQQRWDELDGPDAWSDCISVWKNVDKGTQIIFTESVARTIDGPQMADCGSLLKTSNCDQTLQCLGFAGGGSGAAGYEIWNSMVFIHEMYDSYYTTLYQAAAASLDPALKDFENSFAPIPAPPNDEWLQILLAATSLVGTSVVSGYFNTFLKAAWKNNPISYDNLKDTSKALVSFSVSIIGDLTGKGGDSSWTPAKQDTFSDYMGQVVFAWGNSTEMTLQKLFDGSDDSISLLTTLISDGKFIEGGDNVVYPDVTAGGTTEAELQANIAKSFFAYAIPAIWSVSNTNAFVLDSGFDCGTVDPESAYIDTNTQHQTAGCYNGKLYYLVFPDGKGRACNSCLPKRFTAPHGIDTLDGTRFGGVKVSDLIAGSVRTYIQNGNANGGAQTDPTNDGSLDDLMAQDITTPGFIRLPVCSGNIAYHSWTQIGDTSAQYYPCNVPPTINDCEASTFVDQTSSSSPSVEDCMGIVKNIMGTQGDWEVENAIGNQHQLVQSGQCKFGIQGLNKKGNVDFYIGAQDIVDIINDSIKKFGSGGKIGAKGKMDCKGSLNSQDVEWGIY